MLSRTADHLFWMARYTERAENTARMLDVNIQTQLLPQSVEAAEQSWRALLGISELLPAFDAKYGILSRKDVLDFMVCDPMNPSSIVSCLTSARENARAVRGTFDFVRYLHPRLAEAPALRARMKRKVLPPWLLRAPPARITLRPDHLSTCVLSRTHF